MRKTIALLAFALVANVCALAGDGGYLVLKLKNAAGGVEQVAVQNISSVVFANGSIRLQKDGVLVKSYDWQTVHKLYFSSESTGIGSPAVADADKKNVVYTLEGRLVGKALDANTLPKGVYVIKKGGKARKIVRP